MNKKEIEQIEKDNEDIMTRMHPAAIMPGVLVGAMVIVGCLFKIYMGW